jgi:hypothetical protein
LTILGTRMRAIAQALNSFSDAVHDGEENAKN